MLQACHCLAYQQLQAVDKYISAPQTFWLVGHAAPTPPPPSPLVLWTFSQEAAKHESVSYNVLRFSFVLICRMTQLWNACTHKTGQGIL